MKIRLLSEPDPNKQVWHRWFAWYPVKVDRGVYIWLETVERRYRQSWNDGTVTWIKQHTEPQFQARLDSNSGA